MGELFEVADKAGAILILLIILLGAVKGWWVTGWQYREAQNRENEWKQLALTGTKLAEQVAQRTPDPIQPNPTLAEIVAALRNELGER
jgi:hypothetical protein